jgi:hypothetical protein
MTACLDFIPMLTITNDLERDRDNDGDCENGSLISHAVKTASGEEMTLQGDQIAGAGDATDSMRLSVMV